MRISDWSSDVCSSDLVGEAHPSGAGAGGAAGGDGQCRPLDASRKRPRVAGAARRRRGLCGISAGRGDWNSGAGLAAAARSEEHTSELPSLMRISYAVFCLKKKKIENPTIKLSHHHNKK